MLSGSAVQCSVLLFLSMFSAMCVLHRPCSQLCVCYIVHVLSYVCVTSSILLLSLLSCMHTHSPDTAA